MPVNNFLSDHRRNPNPWTSVSSRDGQQAAYIPNISPYHTALSMMLLALRDVHEVDVIHTAKWLVRYVIDENVNMPLSRYGAIAAIHHWVQSRVPYQLDPVGVECVVAPKTLLDLIVKNGRWPEDCDSISLLTLTLLLALGHDVRLTIAGFDANTPGAFSHVFVEDHIPGLGWFVVDPALGDQVQQMTRDVQVLDHLYPSQVLGHEAMAQLALPAWMQRTPALAA